MHYDDLDSWERERLEFSPWERRQFALRLWEAGCPVDDIARALSISRGYVVGFLRESERKERNFKRYKAALDRLPDEFTRNHFAKAAGRRKGTCEGVLVRMVGDGLLEKTGYREVEPGGHDVMWYRKATDA